MVSCYLPSAKAEAKHKEDHNPKAAPSSSTIMDTDNDPKAASSSSTVKDADKASKVEPKDAKTSETENKANPEAS